MKKQKKLLAALLACVLLGVATFVPVGAEDPCECYECYPCCDYVVILPHEDIPERPVKP